MEVVCESTEEKLLIIGAGGHSQVVREVAESLNFKNFSYLDDNSSREDVIGTIGDLAQFVDKFKCVFISIGDNVLRKKVQREAIEYGYCIPTLVSPYSYVSRTARIGTGCLVCPMACIQSNVVIGDGCFISSAAVIDHNAIIGEYCHINVGAVCTSGTKIGNGVKIENKGSYSIKNSKMEK